MIAKAWTSLPTPLRFFGLLMLCFILGAGLVVFGRYPAAGIPSGITRITILRHAGETPIITLTSPEEIQQARDAAGTIWNGIGYNSLDGSEHYLVLLTGSDGTTTSFGITPTEWSDHAKTPKSFIEFIRQKQAGDDPLEYDGHSCPSIPAPRPPKASVNPSPPWCRCRIRIKR